MKSSRWNRAKSATTSWQNAEIQFRKYKITPCSSATAIGGTIDYVSTQYSASKGIGGVTGGNLIFFRQIDLPFS